MYLSEIFFESLLNETPFTDHKFTNTASIPVSGEGILGCWEQQPPALLLPEADARGQSQAVAQCQCELKFDLVWMQMFGTELVNHMWGLYG